MKISYQKCRAEDILLELFDAFVRRQEVTDCWRRGNDGSWRGERHPFVDDWSEKDYAFLVKCLKNTAQTGGLVAGAFTEEGLKGFVSVEPELFGSKREYLDLSSLHVSADLRGQGIGRALFGFAKEFARQKGAKKLYISAHSAVETQAFYHAVGCVEAKEYNLAHVQKEPFDCQLECLCQTE